MKILFFIKPFIHSSFHQAIKAGYGQERNKNNSPFLVLSTMTTNLRLPRMEYDPSYAREADPDPITEHPYRPPIENSATDASAHQTNNWSEIEQVNKPTISFTTLVQENNTMDVDEKINISDIIVDLQNIVVENIVPEMMPLNDHAGISSKHNVAIAQLLSARCDALSKMLEKLLGKLKVDRKVAAANIASTTNDYKRLYQAQQDLQHKAQLKDEIIVSFEADIKNPSSVLTPYVSISKGNWT
ncbi:MAG: hypothetical protein J3R72DRAFT_453436 [Linnemannia gamsii]|nr:MAG: hypothetical protein J3R72DRAFT_453436 [Linnemannia gamsii]